MKKRIEGYIPRAIELINEVHIANNGIVKNEFNGYFSSFGAAIIQSGLKPALAFFSNTKSDAAANRAKILTAIYVLIIGGGSEGVTPKMLIEYVIDHPNDEEVLKAKIVDASIALKLAVRTFKIEKS
jgi:CRISPR-associated protein Cmr5